MIPAITPKALKLEMEGNAPPVILDVREPHELEVSRLPYRVLNIPMGEVGDRLRELDPASDIVVLCRVGGRSGHVTAFLLGQGFEKVRNIEGGINRWATEVDPSLRAY